MSALTFRDVLEVVEHGPPFEDGNEQIESCLFMLCSSHEDLSVNFPSLARAYQRQGGSEGSIILEVLSRDPNVDPNLYADCYLALADWVAKWNRDQISCLHSSE